MSFYAFGVFANQVVLAWPNKVLNDECIACTILPLPSSLPIQPKPFNHPLSANLNI